MALQAREPIRLCEATPHGNDAARLRSGVRRAFTPFPESGVAERVLALVQATSAGRGMGADTGPPGARAHRGSCRSRSAPKTPGPHLDGLSSQAPAATCP